MTQPIVKEPARDETHAPTDDAWTEGGLIYGRPMEDRSFEVVEATAGLAAGVAIGAVVAGPFGAVVGGLAGAAGGFVAGEMLERAAGRAATTTDAGEPEPPDARG